MDERKKKQIIVISIILTCTILPLGGIGTLIANLATNAYQPLLWTEASISSYTFNNISNTLNCNLNVNVTSFNPNSHFVIIYYNMKAEVYDINGVLLAEQDYTDTLVNRPKKELTVRMGLEARGVEAADLRFGGKTKFEVRLRAMTRFLWKGWKEFDDMKTKAECQPVVVGFGNSSSDAAPIGGPFPCSVSVGCNLGFFC